MPTSFGHETYKFTTINRGQPHKSGGNKEERTMMDQQNETLPAEEDNKYVVMNHADLSFTRHMHTQALSVWNTSLEVHIPAR